MTDSLLTAADVVHALHAAADPAELVKLRRRLPPGEPAIGLRMRHLFDIAQRATSLPPDELDRLVAEPSYEARLAAFCVLDFAARTRLGDPDLRETYLRHHDRISAWDMVDRAAPRVVGASLRGGPYDVLEHLASSSDPLRRRTAITAPLWFARDGSTADIVAGLRVAASLADDPDPVVSTPVGTFVGHSGRRAPDLVGRWLTEHGDRLPAAAARAAQRLLATPGRRGP